MEMYYMYDNGRGETRKRDFAASQVRDDGRQKWSRSP
jgi:hypothetical protein